MTMQANELFLVTGAAGWLGTGLVRALLEGLPEVERLKAVPAGRRLRVLVRPGEDSQALQELGGRIERVEGDVRDPEAAGQIYWIADERPYTMNEIVDTIERLLKDEFGETVKGKRLRLPGLAAEVAGVIDASLQAVGLYHQKFHVLSEMNKTIACKVDRAKAELGFEPTVALEEGMRRSLKWVYANYGGLDGK